MFLARFIKISGSRVLGRADKSEKFYKKIRIFTGREIFCYFFGLGYNKVCEAESFALIFKRHLSGVEVRRNFKHYGLESMERFFCDREVLRCVLMQKLV